jgi:hypothetical protein
LDIGTEEEEELKDALMPKFDQLALKWPWWILEIIPLKHRYQTKDDKWHTWFGWVFILFFFSSLVCRVSHSFPTDGTVALADISQDSQPKASTCIGL